MQHRRIMKMSKMLRGALGIYKCEMIYEYSDVTGSWWMMPVRWYEARAK